MYHNPKKNGHQLMFVLLTAIVSTFPKVSICVNIAEYNSLVDLYESPNGDGWTNNTNWQYLLTINSSNSDELNTICNKTNRPAGVKCDDDSNISQLHHRIIGMHLSSDVC